MAEDVYYATGKRKRAVARVWMRPGAGQIIINNKTMDKYVDREADRMLIMEPLKTYDQVGKFDIRVNVRGGGILGQAGAIRHGISKALVIAEPESRGALKKAGFLIGSLAKVGWQKWKLPKNLQPQSKSKEKK